MTILIDPTEADEFGCNYGDSFVALAIDEACGAREDQQAAIGRHDTETIMVGYQDTKKILVVFRSWSDHFNFVNVVWQDGGLWHVLSALVAARPRKSLPSTDVCKAVVQSVRNMMCTVDAVSRPYNPRLARHVVSYGDRLFFQKLVDTQLRNW
eukprot:scaffold3007_cov157-Amphora_coffeaeformis.AAC.1